MTISIKTSWDDITWKEYEQIEQIINSDIPSDYKAIHLISILTNKSTDEIEEIPVTEFRKLVTKLEFLYTQPKKRTHKMEYSINGRDYIFTGKVNDISTSQYIDYRSYIQEDNMDVVKLFSCFLVPKNHTYNDGYDIEQVWSDINDMCWLDVDAASFFFKIQYAAYILTSKSSLLKTMKKEKLPKKQIKEVEESLNNMAYSLLSSESVPKALLRLI